MFPPPAPSRLSVVGKHRERCEKDERTKKKVILESIVNERPEEKPDIQKKRNRTENKVQPENAVDKIAFRKGCIHVQ